jgi:hypothetical protein
MTHVELSDELCLALSVKAMNDTAGTHGLVPSLLLFGVLPRFSDVDGQLPDRDTRLKAMAVAREEYAKLISQSRISSFHAKEASACSQLPIYSTAARIRISREKQKHWTGPHLLLQRMRKQYMLT